LSKMCALGSDTKEAAAVKVYSFVVSWGKQMAVIRTTRMQPTLSHQSILSVTSIFWSPSEIEGAAAIPVHMLGPTGEYLMGIFSAINLS